MRDSTVIFAAVILGASLVAAALLYQSYSPMSRCVRAVLESERLIKTTADAFHACGRMGGR
jgi:hypothetical protein